MSGTGPYGGDIPTGRLPNYLIKPPKPYSELLDEIARLTVERDTLEENAKYWHGVADGLRETNEKLSADLAAALAALEVATDLWRELPRLLSEGLDRDSAAPYP